MTENQLPQSPEAPDATTPANPEPLRHASHGHEPWPVNEQGNVIYAPGGFGADPKEHTLEAALIAELVPLTVTTAYFERLFRYQNLYRPLRTGDPVTGPGAAYILKDPALSGRSHPSYDALVAFIHEEKALESERLHRFRYNAMLQDMADHNQPLPGVSPEALNATFERLYAALALYAENIALGSAGSRSIDIQSIDQIDRLTRTLKRLRTMAPTVRRKRGRPRKSRNRAAIFSPSNPSESSEPQE